MDGGGLLRLNSLLPDGVRTTVLGSASLPRRVKKLPGSQLLCQCCKEFFSLFLFGCKSLFQVMTEKLGRMAKPPTPPKTCSLTVPHGVTFTLSGGAMLCREGKHIHHLIYSIVSGFSLGTNHSFKTPVLNYNTSTYNLISVGKPF